MNNSGCAQIIQSLWLSSAVFSKSMDNSLGAVHGIGFTEYMVLSKLSSAPNGAMRRVDLADSVARTASAITRMLMPMEKIGLVEKESNSRDARVSLVKITATGQEMLVNANVTLNAKSQALLKNLDAKQVSTLEKLLLKLW